VGAPAERANATHGGGWFGHGGYRPSYVRRDREIRHDEHAAPRRDEVAVRRVELNLYERRHDVRRAAARADAHPAQQAPSAEYRFVSDPANRPNNALADPDGNVHRRTAEDSDRHLENERKSADHSKESPGTALAAAPPPAVHAEKKAPTSPAHAAPPAVHAEKKAPNPAPPTTTAEPARQPDGGSANGDHHARDKGEDRSRAHDNPAPAAPAAPPAPPPAQKDKPQAGANRDDKSHADRARDNDDSNNGDAKRGDSHHDGGSHSSADNSHDSGSQSKGGDESHGDNGASGSSGRGGKNSRH
jgi:hypothetical protein